MKQEHLQLSILGERANSIRLDELNFILQSYQRMLDRSYLALQGESHIRRVQRARFHAYSPSWKKGSIIMDFLIHMSDAAQFVLPLGPQAIDAFPSVSSMMGTVINFYKARAHLRTQHKKEPSVQTAKHGNAIGPIEVIGDNNTIIISQTVKNGADMMEEPALQMANFVRKPGFDAICSSNKENRKEEFSIRTEDAGMLNSDIEHSEKSESMVVRIFQFNRESGDGTLRIVESTTIGEGVKLKFSATADLHEQIIDAMHAPESKIASTRDFDLHPSGERTISRLHIKTIL